MNLISSWFYKKDNGFENSVAFPFEMCTLSPAYMMDDYYISRACIFFFGGGGDLFVCFLPQIHFSSPLRVYILVFSIGKLQMNI